jgi:beta-aspartyl-peptidase (threonine type)
VLGVPNAITLARSVMDSPLSVVVGPGAHEFAVRTGVPTCAPESMISPRERERWEASGGRQREGWAGALFGDTVGAVARDRAGNVAAGTSTGGSPNKPPGRVGDSPFIGAGLYADNESAAVSVTGHGERIIPLVWSKAAADLARSARSAQDAADQAMELLARNGARAGLILVDRSGGIGVAWNTPNMAYAARSSGGPEIAVGPNA